MDFQNENLIQPNILDFLGANMYGIECYGNEFWVYMYLVKLPSFAESLKNNFGGKVTNIVNCEMPFHSTLDISGN